MSKFKQQISEMRKNMPRHIQWLLLGAAFVVVLILLTILVGGKGDNNKEIAATNAVAAELKIKPDMINWADVIVGEKKTEKITISATAPVIIVDVQRHDEISGFDVKDTCKATKRLDDKTGCEIIATYAPSSVMPTKQTSVTIVWHQAGQSEDMAQKDKIVLTLGAVAPVIEEKPKPEPAPKPVVVPEPEPAPAPVEEEEEIEEEEIFEDEPETVQEEIISEVTALAPPVEMPKKSADVSGGQEIVIPDGCSDFAFPGYNNSGRQIGWIKPSGGAYYFHTFDDTDCSEPAGKYNPDNGIITDDSGKKIGTDADHIGASVITSGELPELSNVPAIKPVHRASQNDAPGGSQSGGMGRFSTGGMSSVFNGIEKAKETGVVVGTSGSYVDSTQPYDRSFVLRQFKPIPATIVSDVRADRDMLMSGKSLPVRATVDRNVYSDNGRTVILPTGTLMLGYVTGEIPGPYKAIGRMEIQWYQFIRPDGVEFNFKGDNDPFSADAQGRVGVPGRGSTDYMEQFFMPMLTAFVPAAVNLINPVADAFVNQIDLDNNTVVQSGTMRSSELAKNEIITAWNQVAQKLMVDMMDNTVPPFTIAAGTRITVYSPEDLRVVCEDENKACYVEKPMESTGEKRRNWGSDVNHNVDIDPDDPSWTGQARSFVTDAYCKTIDGVITADPDCANGKRDCGGYSYSTLLLWCKSQNYESKKALQYDAYRKDQEKQYQNKIQELGGPDSQAFNEQILGIQYNDDGTVKNPYASAPEPAPEAAAADVLLCLDGTEPDANGCCTGEIYTDMGEQGFNCCPETGGDCFPPMF
ncbi:MAG: TrbI/VirB10 family protein [Pseudomonadota bacterium]|nr:TrbI/VirB10 family protein [Pseudomonadota bacterium]